MATKSDIESKIFKIVGYQFNLLSNKQLIKAIYEDAGLPVIEKTSAGNPSTTEATLRQLAEDYELARLILDFKKEMKKSSGVREEPKKAPKPGMPQERQVLSRTDIVEELNRDPQEILEDENKKELEKSKQAQSYVEPVSVQEPARTQTSIFVAQEVTPDIPSDTAVVQETAAVKSQPEVSPSVSDSFQAMPGIDMPPPVTVSVAMEVPDDDIPAQAPVVANEPEPEHEVRRTVSFGVSNSFSLSKDQENAHNVIRENEHKDENKPKSRYSLDEDEPSENEFSKNSASLNVKRKEEVDTHQEQKSKVGLYIMVLVVVLAAVLVGICVNSMSAIG